MFVGNPPVVLPQPTVHALLAARNKRIHSRNMRRAARTWISFVATGCQSSIPAFGSWSPRFWLRTVVAAGPVALLLTTASAVCVISSVTCV
ncbi:hypothetical protein BU14_0312s0005 [Porphyra umbilicalis]|uniref:Uncharacterized protein n=1 Tax=Porphyra umbilicalis TaxID=2786 RepID=A0A1X6NZK7_PORUM|nr:hypothetical protein BU14_0312s0005 [Porphyra umbilicalis]|eukprot:OSX74051.1 hypothetical protein BU14_0312s0005 [Porphyra umbilicalis]